MEKGKIRLSSFEVTDSACVLRHPRDPRVVAVLKVDDDPAGPDGDVYAPAAQLSYRGGLFSAHPFERTFVDEEVATAFANAVNHFTSREIDGIIARYMRIFYNTTFVRLSSSTYRDDEWIIFSTPSWREAVGMDQQEGSIELASDIETWQAWLDGDVWAIGVLVNEHHLEWEEGEQTPTDDTGGWEWDEGTLIYGYYGDRDAINTVHSGMFRAANLLDPLEEVRLPDLWEISIETTNPDFVARVMEAFDHVGLDIDAKGEPRHLTAELYKLSPNGRRDDAPTWSTVCDPDEQD